MRLRYSHILMWMLIISPIVDNVNGFLLLNGFSSSLSSGYKILMLGICVYLISHGKIYKREINNILIVIVFFLQLFLFEFGKSGFFSYNLSHVIKLVTPIMIAIAFYSLSKVDDEIPLVLDNIMAFYCWFFPLSLLIPNILGIGFSTYRRGMGSKGFYFAGNEISAVMIVVLAIGLIRFFKRKKRTDFICLLLIFLSYASIATKTSYLVIILETFLVFILAKEISAKTKRIVFGGIGILILGLFVVNKDVIFSVIDNWKWIYANKYTDFASFMLSGRNYKIDDLANIVYQGNSINDFVLGANPGWIINELNLLVEMDFIDLFFGFGIVGCVLITVFYSKFFIKAIKKRDLFALSVLAIVMGNSFFAGHVLVAPMVNIVFILFCLYVEIDRGVSV